MNLLHVLSIISHDREDISHLQFDGDDHRGEVFVQLLQHDQLLQGQVEQPVDKHKVRTFSSKVLVLNGCLSGFHGHSLEFLGLLSCTSFILRSFSLLI